MRRLDIVVFASTTGLVLLSGLSSTSCALVAGLNDFEESGGAGNGSATGGNDGSGGSATGGRSSGGNDGTGGSATGGNDGSGGAPNANASTFAVDGLGQNGDWRGYLGTTIDPFGSTISPSSFEDSGGELCVSGTLVEEIGGWAGVRWNLFQTLDADGIVLREDALPPSGRGIAYEIDNRGGSRLFIQLSTQASQSSSFYCQYLDEDSGQLLWEDFSENCWEPTGVYDPSLPIDAITVSVGSDGEQPLDFDFCIKTLAPIP